MHGEARYRGRLQPQATVGEVHAFLDRLLRAGVARDAPVTLLPQQGQRGEPQATLIEVVALLEVP